MKAKLFCTAYFIVCLLCIGCNDSNQDTDKDPAAVHPPSEAIPDSTRLVNDSVIMPDTTVGNGSQVGGGDSIQRNK